jgi:hypothetical protein
MPDEGYSSIVVFSVPDEGYSSIVVFSVFHSGTLKTTILE